MRRLNLLGMIITIHKNESHHFFLSLFLTAHTHTHTKLKTLETLGRMMKKMKMEMRGNECDGEENDEGMEVMEQNSKS